MIFGANETPKMSRGGKCIGDPPSSLSPTDYGVWGGWWITNLLHTLHARNTVAQTMQIFHHKLYNITFNEDVVLTTLSAKEYELTIGRDNLSQPLVNAALVRN